MSVKLVMTYTEGDGCTYSCDHTYPFEYESAEAALVEFERLFKIAAQTVNHFRFVGKGFYADTFKFDGGVYLPEFYTLDEWFAAQRIDK